MECLIISVPGRFLWKQYSGYKFVVVVVVVVVVAAAVVVSLKYMSENIHLVVKVSFIHAHNHGPT